MKTKQKKHFARIGAILFAAMFLFGTSTGVFAAVDLVGRGTSATVATTVTPSGSSSGSTSQSQTTTSTNTPSATQTPTTTTTSTSGSPAKTTPVVTNTATVNKVGSTQIQTGVIDKIIPFMIGIGCAFIVLLVFFHLQMNQVRYGKSEKYYKELLDFICACKP